MTAQPVVVELRRVAIDTILDLPSPRASEVTPRSDSPVARWPFGQLAASTRTALEVAKRGELLYGHSHHVALERSDAVTLRDWCSATADKLLGAEDRPRAGIL